ncbi:TS1R1 protein, partial [Geococcyx californianus]|nr:TS1R1 protein [Geococcyx californianus]
MPLPALLCLCAAVAVAACPAAGRYRLAGLFPMHWAPPPPTARPTLPTCDRTTAFKSHGYCLSQAMRFTLEEINNSSHLLPGVSLGYDIHDTCSEPASLRATLRALAHGDSADIQLLPSFRHYQPRAVAVIGPDSTQLALTTAAVLGVFLVPEVRAM